MIEQKKKKKRLTSFQIIILGFAGAILLGSVILMLPFSSAEGRLTPFNEALFTSTSAVCVTGLVVHDTASYWSVFGQTVILILIQVGGLGVITVAASFAILSGKKISLMQRSTMQEAMAAPEVGGIVKLTFFILKSTFIIEFAGAVVMMPVFIRDYGVRGIGMAVFHSVSAFCNAGFDVMGTAASGYVSLTPYGSDILINVTVMLLIVTGGLGFLTWEDVLVHRFRFRRYRLQSKVILVTTACLIIVPALFLFFTDFSDFPVGERILYSFFQAITPRTAGFNTVDLSVLSGAGRAVIIILMLTGGSPGSTAGGMKTTTFAVLAVNMFSGFRRKKDLRMFGREIETSVIKDAATILLLYLSLFISGGILISVADGLPLPVCLFETASAVGTVGLSLGITPGLGLLSQCILMILMFAGRVGGLTLMYAALSKSNDNVSKLPKEKITVG
ncbi:MAG: Trk family potassium uptake protein [Clostridia bacterium]|nr:Trk family potassium uptake protein [Clostridia bacterium]